MVVAVMVAIVVVMAFGVVAGVHGRPMMSAPAMMAVPMPLVAFMMSEVVPTVMAMMTAAAVMAMLAALVMGIVVLTAAVMAVVTMMSVMPTTALAVVTVLATVLMPGGVHAMVAFAVMAVHAVMALHAVMAFAMMMPGGVHAVMAFAMVPMHAMMAVAMVAFTVMPFAMMASAPTRMRPHCESMRAMAAGMMGLGAVAARSAGSARPMLGKVLHESGVQLAGLFRTDDAFDNLAHFTHPLRVAERPMCRRSRRMVRVMLGVLALVPVRMVMPIGMVMSIGMVLGVLAMMPIGMMVAIGPAVAVASWGRCVWVAIAIRCIASLGGADFRGNCCPLFEP